MLQMMMSGDEDLDRGRERERERAVVEGGQLIPETVKCILID